MIPQPFTSPPIEAVFASGGRYFVIVAGTTYGVNLVPGWSAACYLDVVTRWEELSAFDFTNEPPVDSTSLEPACPIVWPRQCFAIGLNYFDHAAECGLDIPSSPMVFTKFPSCLSGPFDEIRISSDAVDWETELVVIIGREATSVRSSEAGSYVWGLTMGQDISDRELQWASSPAQFSLGKSRLGFGPVGPSLIPAARIPDIQDVSFDCWVNGEHKQSGNTKNMIFSVGELVSYLSHVCTLHPGDLIFTGTPAGIGSRREPKEFLGAGDVLVTHADAIGTMRNPVVRGSSEGPTGPERGSQ
jgi:2,4-didehydro-3-deoxy-L-rhamnonate hydrolase